MVLICQGMRLIFNKKLEKYGKDLKKMEIQKQRIFQLNNEVIISSKFESGNLSQAIEKGPNHYNLWIGPDHKSSYRTWFYFSIQNIQPNTTVTFTINNMNNQMKLFKEDHLPVFRQQSKNSWQRIKIPIQQNGIVKAQDGFQLTFKHLFLKKSKHFFAFSYPWTTIDSDKFIQNLISVNSEKVFAKYQDFTLSLCKRSVKILTLTKIGKNCNWKQIQIFTEDESLMKPMIIDGKKGIFISARVHPGQVASSHILNGILQKLFSNSEESQILLQKFVFYIIPIINPDGVDQGNFRTDTSGKNLNRCYTNPNKTQQPEIYTLKKFLLNMISNNHIEFSLDLHAHVNKQGVFIYGNSIDDLKSQVQVCLFPKILAYNCPYFDYDACNFSEKNMQSKDKADDLSKEGASRVAIFKETGLKACWTLECNYNSCKFMSQVKNPEGQSLKSVSNGVLTQKIIPGRKQERRFLNITEFHEIGFAICESILDFYALRPTARYFTGKIKNRQNFIINLGIEALRMIPFRFDNNCRKLLTSINSSMNLAESLNKVKEKLSDLRIGTNVRYFPKQYKKIESNKELQKPSICKLPSEIENKNKTKQNNQKIYSLAKRKQSAPKSTQKLSMNNNTNKLYFAGSQGLAIEKNKQNQINSLKLVPKPISSVKKV